MTTNRAGSCTTNPFPPGMALDTERGRAALTDVLMQLLYNQNSTLQVPGMHIAYPAPRRDRPRHMFAVYQKLPGGRRQEIMRINESGTEFCRRIVACDDLCFVLSKHPNDLACFNDTGGDDLELTIPSGTLTVNGLPVQTGDPMTDSEWLWRVGCGLETGYEKKNVYGHAASLDASGGIKTIWDNSGGARWTVTSVVASALTFNTTILTDDTKIVRIVGLDGNLDEVTETLTLNFATPPTTSNSYLRVNELYVEDRGTSSQSALTDSSLTASRCSKSRSITSSSCRPSSARNSDWPDAASGTRSADQAETKALCSLRMRSMTIRSQSR